MSSTWMRPMMLAVAAIGGAVLAATIPTGAAQAASEPLGVWTDHTGRGAVEITQCGNTLCGHIVWTVDSKHKDFCGRQVIGDVRPIRSGTWDKGWIYNPDDDKKYDLELKVVGDDKLQIMGYMGSKFLSQTMTWRRAPADLQRCTAAKTIEAGVPSTGTRPGVASAPASPATSAPGASAPGASAPATSPPATSAEVPAAGNDGAARQPSSPEPSTAPADTTSKSKQRQAKAEGRSKTDANGDDLDIGGLTIKRERTRSGHQCNLAYQQFKVTFPCPD